MQRLRSLEMLRAVAALLVVLFHARIILAIPEGALPFASMLRESYRGVDLFFVLSGFIIAHVHGADIGRPHRLGNYTFNRAARIFPAVWIMTLIAGALSAAGLGIKDAAIGVGYWNTAASLFLLPQNGDPIVNVTWSLKYELIFYIIFGMAILHVWLGIALMGIWQLAVLAAVTTARPDILGFPALYLRPVSVEFAVGVGCAWLTSRPRFISAARGRLTQWGLLLAGVAAFVGGMAAGRHTHTTDASCGLGAAAIIVGLVLLERSGRLPVPDMMVVLGDASYAIYLVHYSAISVWACVLGDFQVVPMNVAVFLPAVAWAIAAGVVFNRVMDKPIQLLLRNRIKSVLVGSGDGEPYRRPWASANPSASASSVAGMIGPSGTGADKL